MGLVVPFRVGAWCAMPVRDIACLCVAAVLVFCVAPTAGAASGDSGAGRPQAAQTGVASETGETKSPAAVASEPRKSATPSVASSPSPAPAKKKVAPQSKPPRKKPAVKKGNAAKPAGKGKAEAGKSKPAQAPKTATPEKTDATPAVVAGFPVADVMPLSEKTSGNLPVAETWLPLMHRLHKDGLAMPYLRSMFGRMGEAYSHLPMGTKVTELFGNKFVPKTPRDKPGKKPDTPPVYRNLVTPEIVARCKAYREQHATAFAGMAKRYGVPEEVVAALLMVETRLGNYLGKNSAFWSLACMAAADTPARVEAVFPTLPLPMTPDKEEWLEKILRERSAWAYKELLALVEFSKANKLDPLVMPGSVYGAIGICQFMPSNLPKFAVDGNMDGVTDLFEPGDAIFSVGNYLKEHGWTGEAITEKTRAGQHATLKRYNKSNVYANTILALAEAMNAPDTPVEAVTDADKKAPAKASGPADKGASVKQGAEKPQQAKDAGAAKGPSAKKGGKQGGTKDSKKSGKKSTAKKPVANPKEYTLP